MAEEMRPVEKETLRRVNDGLYHLVRGLTAFAETRMRARHGAGWRSLSGGSLDASGLLKTMLDNWNGVFGEAFEANQRHEVRNFTSTAFKARNHAAHPIPPILDNEALRYLDAMVQLLTAVKAPEKEVAELKHLYKEQRRSALSIADQLN